MERIIKRKQEAQVDQLLDLEMASEISQVEKEAKLMILKTRSEESSRIELLRSRNRKYLKNKKHGI